jgi:leucyl aminopeptidase
LTTITLTNAAVGTVKADALVVGVAKGSKGPVLAPGAQDVDAAFRGRLLTTLAALGATGKAGEVTKLPAGDAFRAPVLVAVGLGPAPSGRAAKYEAQALSRAAGVAARALAGSGKVALALPARDAQQVHAVAIGALLGAYTFERYQNPDPDRRPPVGQFTLVSETAKDKASKLELNRASVLAEAVGWARDQVNMPPSHLHPAEFADAAAKLAAEVGADIDVLEEKALRKGGFGGIVGVGQGSANPPRLVRISHTHPKAKRSLALVGKGITFDSGGLSLKPASSMDWMKSDMGGAAAVIATVAAVARLGLPVNVTAWAPMAENMPSGTAIRPSDVLTIYGGRTVEVLNTDAEGRLILADALVRAAEDEPDVLVDVATLTGAQLIALGTRTAGIMANDDALRAQVHAAATTAGELMWPMPVPDELRKTLDSEVADIANIGDRNGGMLVAAAFLRDFVDDKQRWAHLDIAGPAWNAGEPYGYTPKGGTGAAVRTLVQLATELAAKG